MGERIAGDHLVARGYRILGRNFRTRHGELDLIAANARSLVFCEVKTRVAARAPGPFGPLSAVGARKRRQVRRMAREWLAASDQGPGPRPEEMRFDAIGVTLAPSGRLVALDHLEDAF